MGAASCFLAKHSLDTCVSLDFSLGTCPPTSGTKATPTARTQHLTRRHSLKQRGHANTILSSRR